MLERRVQIVNKLGLHARAAAKFVQMASQYQARLTIQKDGTEVDGKSILGVLMLAASKGTQVVLRADGPDELAAMEAVQKLIAERFGEKE